jgi:hypothetical protein
LIPNINQLLKLRLHRPDLFSQFVEVMAQQGNAALDRLVGSTIGLSGQNFGLTQFGDRPFLGQKRGERGHKLAKSRALQGTVFALQPLTQGLQ